MAVEQIREVHSARPFGPFLLRLADGRAFVVTHPEFLSLSRSGRILHLVTPEDTMQHIDLLTVVSIEVLSERRRIRRRAG